MKIRQGFVSNSSSSSFIIANNANKKLTIVDFVKENPQLIVEFLDQYTWYKKDNNYTQENLIKSAETRLALNKKQYSFNINAKEILEFGDDDGDLIGHVFDYILREGGESKNFTWSFFSSNR
jgi:hypothetical protein